MDVEEQQNSNAEKLLGGITGKGFMPGQSGNPGGRKPGRSLTALINDVLEGKTLGDKPLPKGRTAMEMLAEAIVSHAIKGRSQYMKELYERLYGKVPDRLIADVANHDADGGRSRLDSILVALRDRRGINAASGIHSAVEPSGPS